jgi:hypothetical protein
MKPAPETSAVKLPFSTGEYLLTWQVPDGNDGHAATPGLLAVYEGIRSIGCSASVPAMRCALASNADGDCRTSAREAVVAVVPATQISRTAGLPERSHRELMQ